MLEDTKDKIRLNLNVYYLGVKPWPAHSQLYDKPGSVIREQIQTRKGLSEHKNERNSIGLRDKIFQRTTFQPVRVTVRGGQSIPNTGGTEHGEKTNELELWWGSEGLRNIK